MLVSGKKILDQANKGRYAVGAFNISNLEILQAVIEGAAERKSPVIVATSESAIKYARIENLVSLTANLAKREKINIALHLDHGKDMGIIKKAVESGYTSVMIDASEFPFEKNASMTKRVVQMAHKKGISVEGELGTLGGKEDYVTGKIQFTDPDSAKEFAEKTGIDCLAVAIGTSHGAYKFKGDSKLDIDRLKMIKNKVKMPLALHGASGVYKDVVCSAKKYGARLGNPRGNPDSEIIAAVKAGINKVNTDTDLRIAFTCGIRKQLQNKPEVFDPREIMNSAKEEMKKMVIRRIKLFRQK